MNVWRATLRAAFVLLACTACSIERPRRTDTTFVLATDSTVAAAIDSAFLPPMNADSIVDTTVNPPVALPPIPVPPVEVRPMEVPPIAATPPAPPARPASPASPAPARASRDTTSIAATDTELRALAATLAIPVAGVKASDLRDGYAEARGARVHEALDIRAPRGTPVLSASDGKLTKLHNSVAGGLMVYAADPTDRFVFMYGHLDRYADGLREGMPLKRGQLLGYVGTTGNAPVGTPHLHFAVARGRPSAQWWKGTAVNPYPLLVPR